jgi:DNA-binding MarR family transcriptional regulator
MSVIRDDFDQDVEQLRSLVQTFVRRFGLLLSDRTPCGQPVSVSYAHALMLLREAGRPLRQSELGAALGIDKSNVARLCTQLEAKGHAEQARVAEDGRGRVVELTLSGQRLAQAIDQSSRMRFRVLLERIPRTRRKAVLAGLSVLDDALLGVTEEAAS